jgi:threonine aldolase
LTQTEFNELAAGCTEQIPGHRARTVRERMQDIADSPYAKMRTDVYGNGGFVAEFEKEIAELLGKESAVFMPSGTMAQQIALRIWADQAGNKSTAFHPTSHLELHEHGAYRELHGLSATLLGESNRLFTLDDLKGVVHRLSSLLIELPQREIGGQLPTWDDLCAITAYAKSQGTRLHLDGARLWECQPYYARPYAEVVADFDSVYVSCYKILFGLPGALLAGPEDFIAEARIWLRRHGGNLVHMFPNAISAKIGVDLRLERIPAYVSRAAEVAEILNRFPGVTVEPKRPPTNMMHLYFDAPPDAVRNAAGQIALREKCLVISGTRQTDRGSKFELNIGDACLDMSSERLETVLSTFMTVLNELQPATA